VELINNCDCLMKYVNEAANPPTYLFVRSTVRLLRHCETSDATDIDKLSVAN
jgi:hypothetical protein